MAITLQAVVALNSTSFSDGMAGLGASVQKFAGVAMMAFGGVAAEISAMWASFGAAGAAMASLKQITAVGAEYEQRMAAVKSVTWLANDAIKKLADDGSAAAKKYGFTLKDTGAAMETLARSGIDTADKLNAILTPALLLAGSQNANLEDSTETLAAAMQAFQLDLSKSTEVADAFAGALAASPLNMERLKDAMKMAAPAAAALGMSVQQTVQEIAAFHTVGLQGALAGTTFRGALLECDEAARNAAGPVGQALKGWSAETEGLTGAVKRLNDAGVPAGVVMEEFGKRAGPGMAQMMLIGSDAINEVAERVTHLSDVQKQYNIQMDTFSGRMKFLKANVEEVAMTLFTALAPALKFTAVAATLTVDAISKMGPIIQATIDLASNFGAAAVEWFSALGTAAQGMVGGLGVLGVAIGLLGPVFLALANTVMASCLSMLKSLMAFIVPALVGIAAVTTAFAAFSLGQIVNNMKVGTDTISGHLTEFFTRVILMAEYHGKMIALEFREMMLLIKQYVLEIAPDVIEAFGKMLAPIIEGLGKFRATFMRALNMDDAANEIEKNSKRMADAFRNINADEALEDTQQALIRLGMEMDDVTNESAEKLKIAMKMAGDAAKENLEKGIAPAEVFDSWLVQMEENAGSLWETIISKGADARGVFDSLVSPVKKATDELGAAGDAVGKLHGMMDVATDGVEGFTPPVSELTSEMGKLGKETIAFGKSLANMNPAKLTAIYDALKDFADRMAKLPKLNLEWMRDLAMLRLPPIGNADNWGKDFDKLITVLERGVGLALTLDWMKPLTEFRLPPIGNADNWSKSWIKLTDALAAAQKPDLSWIKDIIGLNNFDTEKLKTIVGILSGLKAGTYNASVLIGWQDNATLSSIDSSLSKLAAMEGVIWR